MCIYLAHELFKECTLIPLRVTSATNSKGEGRKQKEREEE
jgi:hypothetical protein